MKIKISKEEFEKLYKSKTNHFVATHFGVSMTTVNNWAKKLGIRKDRGSSARYEFI